MATLVVLIAVAVSTTACGSVAELEPAPPVSGVVEAQLEAAREANADPTQIQALEEAVGTGVVTYAALEELLGGLGACLEESGNALIRVDDDPVGPGLSLPGYSMAATNTALSEDAFVAIALDCESRFVLFAYTAARNSPVAQQASDELWEERRDDVVRCLAEAGYPVAADATVAELRAAEYDAFVATHVSCGPDPG